MTWVRARKPEQKEQRRTAILQAAADLFQEQGLDGTSLNAIAAHAGISKGNVYRYFESREEIFLHLLLDDYDEWVADLEQALAPLAGSGDIKEVAQVMAQSYIGRPRFAALAAVTGTVLEQNVTVDAVVWFKTRFLQSSVRLGNAIHAAVPQLDVERTRKFLMFGHFMASGMWPAANPPKAVEEALKRPELQYACIDYENDLVEGIEVLLRGLLSTE